MKKYILALEEGTTSARAILFDKNLNEICSSKHEIEQIYPKPGWVEQNPMDIYANQYSAMMECIAKSGVKPCEIGAIGITNQRETTIVWDKNTKKPIYNAIVWQCRRTSEFCSELENSVHAEYIKKVTGLKLDAYFSASKLKWILDNVEGAREKAEKGDLLFGTVDTFLVWKLTEGKVHVTDRTNASRTMLFNIETGLWDDKLLEIFDIPKSMLPKVLSSSEVFATVSVMGEDIPISGIAGDQQSALFGQGCFYKGDAKSTYGTGCFLLTNTGSEKITSKHGLLTTLTATSGDTLEYALEGSVFVGGAVIQWLRDELKILSSSKESEVEATKVDSNGGVYFVPAFSGLGAPYWDMDARGAIVGLTRGTTRAHIIRAAVESIAFQTNDVILSMNEELNGGLKRLKVDGGASQNDFLLSFQADISNLTVIRPSTFEATALGACMLAGLGAKMFNSKEELLLLLKGGKEFTPKMTKNERETTLSLWNKAVRQTICK